MQIINSVLNKKLLVFLLILTSLFQACKKESSGINPEISSVRLLDSTKRDKPITSAVPGTYIVIQGQGFQGLMEIYFNNEPAPFNSALNSDQNIVVVIPGSAPTKATDPNVPNELKIVTTHGTASFNFEIVAPDPVVSGMSNENAFPGAAVTITGTNFYFIKSVTFPGNKTVLNPVVNQQGTEISLVVPDGATTAGPITVKGDFGEGQSIFIFNNYRDPQVGFLANFEDGDPHFGWQWWGGNKTNDPGLFPGNTGTYIEVHPSGAVNAGDNSWYSDNRAVMVDASTPWVPSANMGDPIGNYALKFEISVKTPWTNGAFMIVPNGNFDYMARYAPWENAPGKKFQTKGWVTVTIPLTSFLSGGGTGSPAPNIAALTGGANAATMQIMLYNDSTTPIESFDAGVDNVRIVKIK